MKILDLRKQNGWYFFRFGGGDDFWLVLDEFKRRIPREERDWDEDEKEWSVLITDLNEDILMDCFENGKHAITMIKNQLVLPGLSWP